MKLTDKARQLAETITLAELLLLEENDADAYLFKTIQLSVHNALREGSDDELWPELQRLCMAVGQEARDDAFKRAATRWKDRPVNDQPQAQPVEINQQRALQAINSWVEGNHAIVDFTRQTALQAVREAKPWSNPEQLQAAFDNALSALVSNHALARIGTGRYLVTARYPG